MTSSPTTLAAAALATLAVLDTGSAQAKALDPFFRPAVSQRASYDAADPASAVLRAQAPGWLTGSTRTLDVAPTSGLPGRVEMGVNPMGESALYASAMGGQLLSASLSYGLDRPLNLDLSADGLLVLHYWYGQPHQLTVYAWTDSPLAGDNPWGSAISLDVGFRYEDAVALPFASFAVNSSTGRPVNWADVDGLSFVFSGPTDTGLGLHGISSAALPVPEPASWALLAAGLLLALRRGRGARHEGVSAHPDLEGPSRL